MLIVDNLIISGVRFVLGKLVDAVDSELTDDKVYREELLAAQMRLELGEISEDEFAEIERDMLAKIREVRERQGVSRPVADLAGSGPYRIEGIEVSAGFDEHTPAAPARRRAPRKK